MKPKILISSERDDPCAKYTAAILAAGGLPTVAYCPQVSLDYDGLLLSGGGDIAPHLFAAEDQGSQDIDYDRDMAELGGLSGPGQAGAGYLPGPSSHQRGTGGHPDPAHRGRSVPLPPPHSGP